MEKPCPRPARALVDGFAQWTAPFFAISAANWVAQYAMQHMNDYGMTREQLAQVAINASRKAVRKPQATTIAREELALEKHCRLG